MQCVSCGLQNRAAARFCGGCGITFPVVCGACGHSNPPDSRFCDACGHSLAAQLDVRPQAYTPAHLAQKILTTRSAMEGERKHVTVLFCDMANSSALARQLGADRMHDTLNAFFELVLAEVHGLEGTVNQFLGDGFMALFGAPLAHEDHVRRALLCALAIQNRVNAASVDASGLLHKVQVRMGLNSGPVVVGRIGDNLRMDYTAIGDTTNIAARLQALAQPGAICVGSSIYEAGEPFFDFRATGLHTLKGIDRPVPVFELLRAKSAQSNDARARGLGIAAPLVGRESELRAATQAVDALREGRGGVMLVTGEPGTGKSRLVAELRRQPASVDVRWLEGRALSFGRRLSYWPFIEILKRCFEIGDDDAEDVSLRKLRAGLQDVLGPRADDVLPYLATVLALKLNGELDERVKYLDGQGLKRQVFLCMRLLFEHLAKRRPLLLVLEDWHWADQSSNELAEHLLPLTQQGALLVLFAARPDPISAVDRLQQISAALGDGQPQWIALSPLTPDLSEALLSNLVGNLVLPTALRDQILRRTEGNPLFLEEVMRSLVSQGALVRNPADHSWQLGKAVDEMQLPDTLQGLILARIDRLDEDVKQALKLASVIGRSFFDRVLEAIGEAQHALPGQLAELEAMELIRDKRRVPEPEHIFNHVLVQEATYSSILAENRRGIHRRVAQAIETLFADRLDEFSSLLAHHYTSAEDWDKAQAWLFKAGDQAGRLAADAEALEHLRQAEAAYLKVYGNRLQPLERAALQRKIGAALYGTGQYEQAHALMRDALAQLGVHYPQGRWGTRRAILKYLGAHVMRQLRALLRVPARRHMDLAVATEISTMSHFMAWMDYFLDKERMLLDSLLELHVGELSHHGLAEARGLSSLGFGAMTFNVRGIARRYHLRAVTVAQQSAHPSAIAFAWFASGFLDFYDGLWDECEARLGKAEAAYRDSGDIHRWGGAALMLSWVVLQRGDVARARSLTTEIVSAGDGAADPQVASWGLQNLSKALMAGGTLAEAETVLRRGQAIAERIGAWDNLLHQKSLLANCLVLQGRVEEAAVLLEEAERVMRDRALKLPFDQIEVLVSAAVVRVALAERAATAQRPAALSHATRACQAALRCARLMPLWMPQVLRVQGTLSWLEGDTAAAHTRWRESLDVSERAAFPIERALTLFEKARRLGDADLLNQAAVIFKQTGAHNYWAMTQTAGSA